MDKTHLPGAKAHPLEMRRATLVRLEKAVFALFSKQAFHQIALADIAAEAHVSLQTIYKYFGGKDQLVFWVIDHTLTRLAKRMVDQLRVIENFKMRLSKTLWIMLDYFDKHPLLIQLLNMTPPAAQFNTLTVYENPELMEAFLGLFKEGQQQGQLREDVPIKMLFDVFMGILARVIQMHTERRETTPLLDQHPMLLSLIWNALRAEGPDPAQVPRNSEL